MKTTHLFGGALALAMAAIAAPAAAEYPEKPVSFIVPWPPGDLEDVLTRMIAEDFAEEYGVAAAVVNKPGGGGRAAIPDFMTAPADGYTVMEHIDDAATLYASGKINENPAVDWVPLAMAQILQQLDRRDEALVYAEQALALAPAEERDAISALIDLVDQEE